MLVRDVLRGKGANVATIPGDAKVRDLLKALAEHNVGALVVSSDGVSVSGVVSERDVVRALNARGTDLLDALVAEIMTGDVTTGTADASVDVIMQVMTERRIRHVPIVTDGRLAGIVSIGDVVKTRMSELESERESLIGYIGSSG